MTSIYVLTWLCSNGENAGADIAFATKEIAYTYLQEHYDGELGFEGLEDDDIAKGMQQFKDDGDYVQNNAGYYKLVEVELINV